MREEIEKIPNACIMPRGLVEQMKAKKHHHPGEG
jgi:hypothetical protein